MVTHACINQAHDCLTSVIKHKMFAPCCVSPHIDLTSESQAKLAKAKSRGLTCTLVTEAINSNKSWEEIKDLLCPKLWNANIYTYISHFMDIQQW